jgi:hypothetical protein
MTQSYYINSPYNYLKLESSSCPTLKFESSYDQSYGKSFCQQAQSAYTSPDKVAYGIYPQIAKLNKMMMINDSNLLKENYAPNYSGLDLYKGYIRYADAGKLGCGCGCK